MKEICMICGREFERHNNKKTCSIECRKKRIRDTFEKWKAENPERYRKWQKNYNSKHSRVGWHRKCIICGKSLYLSKEDEPTKKRMHDTCVYDDVLKTIIEGKPVTGTQRNRLYSFGYTVKTFREDYVDEIREGSIL